MNLGLASIKNQPFTGMSPEAINTMKQEGSPMAPPMAPPMRDQGITPLLDALVEERLIKEKREKANQMALSMGINPNSVVDQNKQELRSLTQREMVDNALKVPPRTAQQLATIRRNAAKTLNKNFGLARAPIKRPMRSAQGGIVEYDNGGAVERPSFLSNLGSAAFDYVKENPLEAVGYGLLAIPGLGQIGLAGAGIKGLMTGAKALRGLGGLASKPGVRGAIGRVLQRGYTIPAPSPYSAIKIPKVGQTNKVNIPLPRQFSTKRAAGTAGIGLLGANALANLAGGAEQPPTVTPTPTTETGSTTATTTTPKKKGILSPIGTPKQQQAIRELSYILTGGPQNIASRSRNIDTLKQAKTIPTKDVFTAYNTGMKTLTDINKTLAESVGDLAMRLPEGQALQEVEAEIRDLTAAGKEVSPELLQRKRDLENNFILAADRALGGGDNVMGLYQQQLKLTEYLQVLQSQLGMSSMSGFDPSKGAEIVG